MIAKGCTCKNIFSIPFAESELNDILITYEQKGKIIFEKKKSDCTFDGCKVSVNLTQEDTLKLDENAIIRIQIKVKTREDDVIKSNIMETYTDEILNSGVM